MKIMKRSLSVLLSVLMIVSLFTVMPFYVDASNISTNSVGAKTDVLFGDVNKDGQITFSDVTGINAIIGNDSVSEETKIIADVNGDGVVDYSDVEDLQNARNNNDIYSLPIYDLLTDSGYCGNNGDNVKYMLKNDGSLIIFGEGEMSSYYKSASSIPWYNFRNSIKEAIIKNGVSNIRSYAFDDCKQLSNVSIPDSVTSINFAAFRGCNSLETLMISNGVSSIDKSTFRGCTSLKSIIVASENNFFSTKDGNLYNQDETELIKYAIGKTSDSFTIPYGVKKISEEAFGGSENIKSITIPESVETINCGVYNLTFGCPNLSSISVDSGNKAYSSVDGNLYNKDKTYLISYSQGKSDDNFIIPVGVNTIGYGAFYNSKNLKSIVIPNSVTAIGWFAFTGCTSLNSLVLPDSVTSIGSYAFSGCTSLMNLTIGNGIKRIDSNYAFALCENLISLTLSKSVEYIGYGTFDSCEKLSIVNFYGSESDWNNVTIGDKNSALVNATLHYIKESTNGIVKGSDNVGEGQYYTTTLNNGETATITIIDSVLTAKVRSTEYTFKVGSITKVTDSAVINENDSLLHIITLGGAYYVFDLLTGKQIMTYRNSSTGNYCLSGNSNAYAISAKSFIDNGNFYETNSGATLSKKLMSRDEFDAISSGKEPVYDTTSPSCSISSTNNLASSQTVTLSLNDNLGIAGYYWGTSSSYSSNTYTSTTSTSITKTILSSSTYYLTAKDSAGNVSTTQSITFYSTFLNANGGTLVSGTPSTVLTASGYSFTPSLPTRIGFEFVGWSTSSTATTGSKTISPSGNNTYYAIWKDTTKPTCAITSTNNLATEQAVTLSMSDNVGIAGYYWGPYSNYEKNTYTNTSSTSVTKTATVLVETYYLTVKDTSGNLSDTKSITFYSTTLNANGGTLASGTPSYVLTESGNSFTPTSPTRSGYAFVGWSTSSSATTGSKTITPSSNTTYYAVWKDIQPPEGSIIPSHEYGYSTTVNLSFSDNVGIAGYYWGKSTDYKKNTYKVTSSLDAKEYISVQGTYYLNVVDISGNVSNTYSVDMCFIYLQGNGGNPEQKQLIAEKGYSFTPEEPTRNGYDFVGWNTSSTATTGSKTIIITSFTTYYAVWKEIPVSTEVPTMATEPSTALPAPITEAPEPTMATSVPTTTVPEPTTAIPVPTTATLEPVTEVPEPTTAEPVTETLEPTTVAPEPVTKVPEFTTVAPEPVTEVPEFTTVAPEPVTEVPESTTTAAPESTTVVPEPTTVAPESTTVAPEPTTIVPEPTTVAPTEPTENVVVHSKSKQFITAKSYTKAFGSKSFTLKAKTNGDGKLSYKSSNKKVVTVSSKGKVKIKGCGKATITISASATSKFFAATKKIIITVKPGKVKLKAKKIYTKNGSYCIKQFFAKQKNCDGYEWQLSPKKSFPINYLRSKYLSKSKKYIFQSAAYKGRKYYIRIRAYKKIGKKTVNGKWSKIIVFKT